MGKRYFLSPCFATVVMASLISGLRATLLSSARLRTIAAEGDAAEMTWDIKTRGDVQQFSNNYAIGVKHSQQSLWQTLVGQKLILPLKGTNGKFNISLEDLDTATVGKEAQLRLTIRLNNAKLTDGGKYTVSLETATGQNVKSLTLHLLVVRLPKMSVQKTRVITGKSGLAVLKWNFLVEGGFKFLLQVNEEFMFSLVKENSNGRRTVLFQKTSSQLLRLPSLPNTPLPQPYKKRLRLTYFIGVKVSAQKVTFGEDIVLKIRNTTGMDNGFYSLHAQLPSGAHRLTKKIKLEILDCWKTSCYRFYPSPSGDWLQNRRQCQQKGGDLVRMKTADEWRFIRDVLKERKEGSLTGWYIGLANFAATAHAQIWGWVATNVTVAISDNRWYHAQGLVEPNGDGRCAEIRTIYRGAVGKFYDSSCSENKGYICEVPK